LGWRCVSAAYCIAKEANSVAVTRSAEESGHPASISAMRSPCEPSVDISRRSCGDVVIDVLSVFSMTRGS
jgi:hypothetical protein